MAFRGFTWNLTRTEAANAERIFRAHADCVECRHWDHSIAVRLADKAQMFLELSTDHGTYEITQIRAAAPSQEGLGGSGGR